MEEQTMSSPQPKNPPNWDLDDLKNQILDGLSLEEIGQKDKKWCVHRWNFIQARIHMGRFTDEVINDIYKLLAKAQIALEDRAKELGATVIPGQKVSL